MSDYGYAYGASAALTAAAAPFNNLPLPAGIDLEPEHFDHDAEQAVDFEYLGYEYDPEHAEDFDLDIAVDADANAHAEAGVVVDADYDDDESGEIDSDIDIDIYNQHFRAELESLDEDNSPQPLSPASPSIVPWHSSPDREQSRSEGGVGEEEDDWEHEQDEHAVVQQQQQQQHHYHSYPQHYEELTESEDDRDQISQSDVQDFDNPTHHDLEDDDDAGFEQDHAGEGSSSQEQFVISSVDNSSDDEPQSSHSSSRTASLPPDGITLLNSSQSLSVTPPARRFQAGANSQSDSDDDSDLITISDIVPTSSASGTASQQHLAGSASGSSSTVSASSSSQGSRSGPREPHRRQRLRRLSVHSGLDINLQNNNNNNNNNNNFPINHHRHHQPHYHHRPSPRLSSLTPVLHPNRRLPRRPSPANRQSSQNFGSATASPSNSSVDELILPPPQRRLGIERTRRPIFTNTQSSVSDQDTDSISSDSSDSSDSSSSGDLSPSPYLGQLQDHNPDSQHRAQRLVDRLLDRFSDRGEHDPLRGRSLPQSGEEESDNPSQSDLEEISTPNNPSGGGRSRAGGPARGHLLLDGVHADHDGDFVLQEPQEYHEEGEDERTHIRAASSSEEDEVFLALVARESPRRRQRLVRELRQHRERGAAARAQRRRIAANPFLDSDLEQSDADMDGDDELVEVVFDRQLNGPHAPPLQRQPRHQQRHRVNRNNSNNNNNNNNRVQAVELIDLTEEPDSPVQNHSFQNQGIAHQHFNRHPQRPRHHRRMPQNGQPPSLARSDGSLLGGQRGPAVIDLTNDESDFQAVVDDDDDDDLFVEQDFDAVLQHLPPNDFDDFLRHIPPNRRLPDPVPGPPHRDRRRSVEFIGFAARHLRNVGGQYLPGLLAALPGIPRGIANEIAIIGRDQGLAMNPNPLADNPPDFNYQANGFGGRPPPPKPEFEAPPPARPGFTRNTGKDPETGEELVIVCASCDNELKYDEEEDDGPRPAKRPRNRKDREEHHFWAVKACGHVYCKSCYDNRKKTKGKEYAELDIHFRVEQTATAKTAKIICAVDNCNSDVTQNNCWVGIFM